MNKNTRKRLKKIKLTPNSDGVISVNERRNTQMRVLHNTGAGGGSLTVHEPIYKSRYVIHKNHKYLDYRQPS